MKALVGPFNQEKALVGAFSVIVKTDCGTDGALHSSTAHSQMVTLSVILVFSLGAIHSLTLSSDSYQGKGEHMLKCFSSEQ